MLGSATGLEAGRGRGEILILAVVAPIAAEFLSDRGRKPAVRRGVPSWGIRDETLRAYARILEHACTIAFSKRTLQADRSFQDIPGKP